VYLSLGAIVKEMKIVSEFYSRIKLAAICVNLSVYFKVIDLDG